MGQVSEIAKVHARCVWWLSGQCHGGEDCGCIQPEQPPASDDVPPQRRAE
jgi:hypothetical protein